VCSCGSSAAGRWATRIVRFRSDTGRTMLDRPRAELSSRGDRRRCGSDCGVRAFRPESRSALVEADRPVRYGYADPRSWHSGLVTDYIAWLVVGARRSAPPSRSRANSSTATTRRRRGSITVDPMLTASVFLEILGPLPKNAQRSMRQYENPGAVPHAKIVGN
jgi:hypothetical protein